VFFLAYHLHWTPSEATDLPSADRRAYVNLLLEQLEREHDALERGRE
jgi:hypothetical protein